jgi:hypothetical protein
MLRTAQGTLPPIATIETGITATAGGTKAAARVLTAAINVISVCATAADSVLLMPALAGLQTLVCNRGAASCQVFGAGTDTIDDVATATGVAQATLKNALYTCVQDGKWQRVLSA